MPSIKLNILVYAGKDTAIREHPSSLVDTHSKQGNSSTIESVRHCLWSLRRLLSPNYAVIPISSDAVLKEPWSKSCALFVMPGGADLGYCRILNGHGNNRIRNYVAQGGSYLGFCAGGYYGSNRCEFEIDNPSLEVAGDRELGFFPGICRGCAFRGFVYHSEAGAKAARLNVVQDTLPSPAQTAQQKTFRSYYNGGGVFVNAAAMQDQGVEILASYADPLDVDSGQGQAAVVYRRIDEGHVVLTGPHPEYASISDWRSSLLTDRFAPINLPERADGNPDFYKVKAALTEDDAARVDFLKACLTKLGLDVSSSGGGVPSLSRLHLSCSRKEDLVQLEQDWASDLTQQDGRGQLAGENDTFLIEHSEVYLMDKIMEALPGPVTSLLSSSTDHEKTNTPEHSELQVSDQGITDYDKVTKRLVIHQTSLPETKETPYFNHHAFFSNLSHYNTETDLTDACFGRTTIYAEVITSTSTILEKNPKLLQHLPTGTTAVATTQVAGRGRGSNIWVSPPGALMFSTVLRHPLTTSSPVVLVQYLAALAVVTGIRSYETGYDALPIRLKWPNDIYILHPDTAPYSEPNTIPLSREQRNAYVKVSGILVNSSYTPPSTMTTADQGFYTLVAGIGINVNNSAPICSLNQIIAQHFPNLEAFTLEKLLASILTQFEVLHDHFCQHGFDEELMNVYRLFWLHERQAVTIPAQDGEGERRVRVKGISPEWGFLEAEEVSGEDDKGTGRMVELLSDANSFDFFEGLIMRKK